MKKGKKIVIGVAAVAVVAGGFYAVSGGSRGEAQLPQVSVTKAETGDVEEIVDATGTVVSDEQKTFYSPVNAQIKKKYLLQKAIPSPRVQNLWNLS